MYDIIVVGAGPAGLTAAIYARRAGKSVLILERDSFGGQIVFSPKVENYPGFESVSGAELADKLVSQALFQGADVEVETVSGIRTADGVHYVDTEDGNTYEGRAVIIANGARHRHLGVPNEEKFIGDGISFCAVCDGAFYKDKTVGLVGGGNSALQEAILLSETCKKVIVIQNLDYLTGEQRLQEILRERENEKNSTTSPSCMTYSLPSERTRPFSLQAAIEPCSTSVSYGTTAARMKPRSKSLWILPAACGALVPFVIVHARTSLGPAVRKLIRPSSR